MDYLRAIISSDPRGSLYKKDFEVQRVFDTFVRTYVSTLINAGLIYEGEFYSALIIPRYGRYKQMRPKVSFEETSRTRTLDIKKQPRWITLSIEEPERSDRPMEFFTLELHIVGRPLIYRDDFPLYEIDYFWHSIERALAQMNVLSDTEQRRHSLYALSNDQYDFDREELYSWQADADELIEMVSPDDALVPAVVSFPRKALQDFPVLGAKKLVEGKLVDDTVKDMAEHAEEAEEAAQSEIQILITRSAMEAVQHIARTYVDTELGGMVIGHIYENAEGPGYIVEITDHVFAEGALASETELRFTFEAWQRQTTLLREHYPGKRIVGWYHTHLDLVKKTFYIIDDGRRSKYTSALFFSQDDLFTHRQFFREKWYVAIVLNSEGNLVFFQWEGNDIVTAPKFYVIEDEVKAEQQPQVAKPEESKGE